MKIVEGMKVRSEDFQPRMGVGDCYMEGIVTHVHGLIHAKTTRIVFDGKELPIGDRTEFSTAPAGSMICDWDSRITVIE